MKQADLQALHTEYTCARVEKENRLHQGWQVIMDEYGMRTFGQVVNYVRQYRSDPTAELIAGGAGRVASLNLIVRKMAGLGNLRDPEFRIGNKSPWDEPIAALLQSAFDTTQRSIGWSETMDEVLLWAVMTGTGCCKLGMNSEYVYAEPAWSAPPPRGAALPSDAEHFPYGVSTEYGNFAVKEGLPNLVSVPTTDIFLNPGVTRWKEAQRIYHRSRRPLRDVLFDSRYDRAARAKVREVEKSWRWNVDKTSRGVQDYAGDLAVVEVVECFDLASRQFCLFVEDVDLPLRDWSEFPLPVASPYVFLTPIPALDDPLGISYAELILGQAQAINKMRALLMDAIARDGKEVRIWDGSVVDKSLVDEVNAAQDGADIYFPTLRDGAAPFQTLSFGGARPEVLRLASLLEGDMAWVSGLTDEARNQAMSGDRTATEVSVRQQQQGLLIDEFVRRNERFQESCAAGICQIMTAFWPASKMLKVTGPSHNLYFYVEVERARVLGEWTIEVVAGSSIRQDRSVLRRQWLELLPRLMEVGNQVYNDQLMQMQGNPPHPVNWMEVLRETLQHYDPTLPSRILHQQNTAELMIRLQGQQGIHPRGLSPELAQQVNALAKRGSGAGAAAEFLGSGNPLAGVPFEVRSGIPAPSGIDPLGGVPGDGPGMVGGRALSEAMQN